MPQATVIRNARFSPPGNTISKINRTISRSINPDLLVELTEEHMS